MHRSVIVVLLFSLMFSTSVLAEDSQESAPSSPEKASEAGEGSDTNDQVDFETIEEHPGVVNPRYTRGQELIYFEPAPEWISSSTPGVLPWARMIRIIEAQVRENQMKEE